MPHDFLEGDAILISTIQKLFNGLSKFGVGPSGVAVSSIVIDDAHACIEAVRKACTLKIGKDDQAYAELKNLFSEELRDQGIGTFAEIESGLGESFLSVPYWAWSDKISEVVGIISRRKDSKSIKFAWPILKNNFENCQCIIAGDSLEIAPYLAPLHMFPSYFGALHRVFMSATIADDSFLIKGLNVDSGTVLNPLTYDFEKWSGEKMVLVPNLIHESLNRERMVEMFAKPDSNRKFGIVALTPAFSRTKDWSGYHSIVAETGTIDNEVKKLRNGNFVNTLVVANRYDGIDLPDNSCRILIIDSKPFSENLDEKYEEDCRSDSDITNKRIARSIEQGMGRSVRGEKDYCVVVLIDPGLVKFIRLKSTRKHISPQTNKQIEIGIQIAQMAQEEIVGGKAPVDALVELINQSLRRDTGWKTFYAKSMDQIVLLSVDSITVDILKKELSAETKYLNGRVLDAAAEIQSLIDAHIKNNVDIGWYLQIIARYLYKDSKIESNKCQGAAHSKNRYLLKPRTGMCVEKICVVSQKRVENIVKWLRAFANYDEMSICIDDILDKIRFGVKADKFEGAFNDLSFALGFAGQRPDKEWKEGPDNLWGLKEGMFLVVECKSEVSLDRADINKDETDQMNKSCAWFAKNYPSAQSVNIMIIPPVRISRSAAFMHEVRIMNDHLLKLFRTNVRGFFTELKQYDLLDLSESKIQEMINTHNLSVDDFLTTYSKPYKLFPSR